MAFSPSHRPTHSATVDNLQLQSASSSSSPTPKQQRRMTSPLPPPASLNLPEGPGWQQHQQHRPPSPLRNGYTADSSTGIEPYNPRDDEDDDDDPDSPDRHAWERSPSPTSSVSHIAASLAQRVNSFVGGIGSPLLPMTPGLGSMPSDAELEAEAEREREKSRREAEKIMSREAQERERKLLEQRVLTMMENTRALPPPPSKSPNRGPPSPAGSATSSASTSWWATAKNRLMQKEPLTPAQQVILDAKAKERSDKKPNKGKEREHWPANAQGTVNDPAYTNLNIPAQPTRKPVPASPTSPTPSRPAASNMAPNLSPSPMRSVDGGASPSREAPPLYAQFNSQGVLDIPGTLLTIVRRFEKLEKWTVGHVRALEERMGDVERWLVDKEKEKEKEKVPHGASKGRENGADVSVAVEQEVRDMREEVTELSSRVSELGREVAKLVVSPSNLSSGPNRQSAQISMAPQTTSAIVVHANTTQSNVTSPSGSRLISSSVRDTTITPLGSSKTSGTRLPYPTGDYASPEMGYQQQGGFSPNTSPTSSLTSASRKRPLSISGLPSGGNGLSYTMGRTASNNSVTSPTILPLNLRNGTSPPPPISQSSSTSSTNSNRAISPSSGLPAPRSAHGSRQSSVSPTPRKRYTVALGGSISAPEGEGIRRAATPIGKMGTAYFSSADDSDHGSLDGSNANGGGKYAGTEDDAGFQDETIGKSSSGRYASAAAVAAASAAGTSPARTSTPGTYPVGDYKYPVDNNVSPASTTSPGRKARAQSMYGYSSITSQQSTTTTTTPTAMASYAAFNTTAPLRPRVRSKSSDPSEDGGGAASPPMPASATFGPAANNKFVDPLLLRRQDRERERTQIAMPRPIGKVPITQLVAFFDGDKK